MLSSFGLIPFLPRRVRTAWDISLLDVVVTVGDDMELVLDLTPSNY